MTLEDETGIANIVVWPKVMEQYRKEVMGARLILVEGYIQSSPEEVTHLVAQRMIDRSHDLVGLANDALSRKHRCRQAPALIEPLNDDRRDHAGHAGAEGPPSPQRPHPAAVAGFSLRLLMQCRPGGRRSEANRPRRAPCPGRTRLRGRVTLRASARGPARPVASQGFRRAAEAA